MASVVLKELHNIQRMCHVSYMWSFHHNAQHRMTQLMSWGSRCALGKDAWAKRSLLSTSRPARRRAAHGVRPQALRPRRRGGRL